MISAGKPRLLVFIVAYQAEKTIASVLRRIPAELGGRYEMECLIIDDSSRDQTFAAGRQVTDLGFPLTVLYNPVNQGYGGNQKIGYHYAMEKGFDFVALLHGDGQYAPECLGDLLEPLRQREAEAVFGSRMLTPAGALRGGMPLYKFVGNKILTYLENRLLRTHLSEFHSGYRIYSVEALRRVPFDLNSNGFHFDTEIIIQMVRSGARIHELPIPTYYGDEICRVNGLEYAGQVLLAVLRARLQEKGIFYERKFDCQPGRETPLKLGFASPHTFALEEVAAGSRVLVFGYSAEALGEELRRRKGCQVVAREYNLESGLPAVDMRQFDYVLLLDVLEKQPLPEQFVDSLRRAVALAPGVRILASSANVGFLVIRIMLLLGQFNYGQHGILNLRHTRLFTFASLRRLWEQGGFQILKQRGIPGPFPLALGEHFLSRFLILLNRAAIRVSRRLFSYQICFVLEPRPSLELLLARAHEQAEVKSRG